MNGHGLKWFALGKFEKTWAHLFFKFISVYIKISFSQILQMKGYLELIITQIKQNKTPEGDSVGCFAKGALHWNKL